jgi:release factor glutamine methyltransferase
MHLERLLGRATERLDAAGSPSARRDAEVLLCHVLGVDLAWLYTWGDREAPILERARYEALVAARVVGKPVAYLTGKREFWGLVLSTAPDTLIPRPDTETLVEAALDLGRGPVGRLLDLGTGTGAIALAFASERPGWAVRGVDISPAAVALARQNAERLCIDNVDFRQSDWFSALAGEVFELVVANPPYIAEDDPHLASGDLRFEPRSALVSADQGLADLCRLAQGARRHLAPGGWVLLEHGHTQAARVRDILLEEGFLEVASVEDLGGHERVSLGRQPVSVP